MNPIQGIENKRPDELAAEFGIPPEEAAAAIDVAKNLGNQRWRLDNLYKIVAAVPVEEEPFQYHEAPDSFPNYETKEDFVRPPVETVIPFRMNYAQKLLYLGFWYCNLILKSRQHGITTFICLLYLDICMFNSNTHACIIAHNREDAEDFFEKKILFAYENLPDWLKEAVPAKRTSSKKLVFENGSSIRVTTSGRSGTYHLVHISEFGKMCAKFPLKAKEVISGTLNAVHPGMLVSIESTAEGREGRFYDMTQTAMKLEKAVKAGTATLNKMDYKFHFFGWDTNQLNQVDPEGVVFYDRHKKYFEEIETILGRKLSLRQKAWYVKKESSQGDLMLQEHPSTPKEAFHQSIEGAYYYTQMMQARKDGRIAVVPVKDNILVDTWWDLGYNDVNAIWFTQNVGREIHVVNYYENANEGMMHYAQYCNDFREEYGFIYGVWMAPHDIVVHEWTSGKTRLETAKEAGIVFGVGDRVAIPTQHQLVRNILKICVFDESRCEKGLAALDSYRKEWNEKSGAWKNTPYHDWASNGASAFSTMACNNRLMSLYNPGPNVTEEVVAAEEAKANSRGWT